jgi:hypothetical protein
MKMKTKGKLFDPVGRNKLKKKQVFEVRKYSDRIEYILEAKNIPSDGKFIIGSDQEYRVIVKQGQRPEMAMNITISGTNTETGEYFECGFLNGKFKVLKGIPPKKLKLTLSSENLYIITERLDR